MVHRRSLGGEEFGGRGGPPLWVLDHVQELSALVIDAGGGTRAEADVVATEVILYLLHGWTSLGLECLVADERAWTAHLQREIYRRWLANLSRVRGRWAVPVSESLARARLRALAEVADLPPLERDLFDHVNVFGFSLSETAQAFGLDRAEVARRLRLLWTLFHSRYADLFDST